MRRSTSPLKIGVNCMFRGPIAELGQDSFARICWGAQAE
jgi:hypothetical protein